MRILQRYNSSSFTFGPFNATTQTRWSKKPTNTARTRLETRTRDPKFDQRTSLHHKLSLILSLHRLISARKRGPFVSLQLLSRWAPHACLVVPAAVFIRKYPHVFEVFSHPVKQNPCCKFTSKFVNLLKEEENAIVSEKIEHLNVLRIKKILLMSVNGSVHLHALRLMRNELGLPENFRESIIRKHEKEFKLVDLEIVELVNKDKNDNDDGDDEEEEQGNVSLRVAEVEKWREKEYTEKWLSEFEVKYAFPMNFPTGFKKEPGFNESLRNWQRLSYVKPYARMEVVRVRTCGGVERYEKRAVGIIHELLCLTVEKMVEVERLAHFRKDLGIEVNMRELLLKHPGIFYISTKGNMQMVFLREAYDKGCLIEPNPIYDVRRKMLELILLRSCNTGKLSSLREFEEEKNDVICKENYSSPRVGDFVTRILESAADHECNTRS